VGGLSVAAALSGNPIGSAGWGSAILLAGTPLFVNSMKDKWARRPLMLVLWILSGLPFALTASAWSASIGSWIWVLPVFLAGQAMLLAGSFHQGMRPQAGAAMRVEVLALQGIQLASVGLPLIAGILLGLIGWPGARLIGAPLAALPVIPLAAGLVWAKRRLPILNPGSAEWFPKWLTGPAASVRREGSRFADSLQRLATGVTRTMEGEAGIMWGLLFLVLFVSLIAGGSR